LFKQIKHKIFSWLGLLDNPSVKVYNGFVNETCIIVMVHVIKLSPRQRKTFNTNLLKNFFSLIRLFMVSPYKDAVIFLKWGEETFITTSESDGFFKFEFCPKLIHEPGWYDVEVFLDSLSGKIRGHGSVFIPYKTQVAFISDIDDTLLVSHTSNLAKRLLVLLTRNERSRKSFEGVINHYQLLANSSAETRKETNPFFYVSSSEWNLYSFLMEFTEFNQFPKGVFLLGQMKKIKDFWRSGQNNHSTKFIRIVRILETYSTQKFVLLGDDSQQDPVIYESIAEHFPDKILAVYLRKVRDSNYKNVTKIAEKIQSKGVAVCYFKHSAEAVIHSKKIGLILE
jgi:phosphatidate phosphatase APP1